jgi:hypothetical protein
MSYTYSNYGYLVLAAVTERLTGRSFEDAFQHYVAKPLGMTSSGYDCPQSGSTPDLPFVSNGFCTTASDYGKLMQMLVRGGVNAAGERVLSTASLAAMTSAQTGEAQKAERQWYRRAYKEGPSSLFPTGCVGNLTNSAPVFFDSVLDYGFGVYLSTGFRYRSLFHICSQGWSWYWVPGQYAVVFAISNYNNHTQNLQSGWHWASAVERLESDSFPDRRPCAQDEGLRDIGFENMGTVFMYMRRPQCETPLVGGQKVTTVRSSPATRFDTCHHNTV